MNTPAKTTASPGDGAGELIQINAAQGAGQRLDRFLAGQLSEYSRARLQRWIALGAVTCPTRAVSAKTRLTGHGTILVRPQPMAADNAFVAEPVDFDVVWESEPLLVVNKHAGLVVHPGAGNWQGTLMNGLLHRFPELATLPRAGIVHRLDKDTTGLMVVARNETVRQSLVGQLQSRLVSRRYLAVCDGTLSGAISCDEPIGRDIRNRLRMSVRTDGREARTMISALAHGQLRGRPVSLVHCQLATGRTHQIRVHLQNCGHPLIGDGLYGGPGADAIARQALHAYALKLAPGVAGAADQSAHWIASLPDDLHRLLTDAGILAPDLTELAQQ